MRLKQNIVNLHFECQSESYFVEIHIIHSKIK